MSRPADRAAVVTRAIRRVLIDIAGADNQDQHIKLILRDEFDEVKREAAADLASKDP